MVGHARTRTCAAPPLFLSALTQDELCRIRLLTTDDGTVFGHFIGREAFAVHVLHASSDGGALGLGAPTAAAELTGTGTGTGAPLHGIKESSSDADADADDDDNLDS